MGLLQKIFGTKETIDDIDTQLGLEINAEPSPALKAMYLQLLVGFQLIREGNTYPGYAMVQDECVAEPELRLIQERHDEVVGHSIKSHAYWRTAVLGSHYTARKHRFIPIKGIEWVEHLDPVLFSAMMNIGQVFCHRDCGGLMTHYTMEHDAGQPLKHIRD